MTLEPGGSEQSAWKRLLARFPELRPNLGLSPSISLGRSKHSREVEAVRQLCISLSRRGVLFKGLDLERAGEAGQSAEKMIEEAHEARKELPAGSPLDSSIEWLQDACN